MTERDDRKLPSTVPRGHEPEGVRVRLVLAVVLGLVVVVVGVYLGVDLFGRYEVAHRSFPPADTDLLSLRTPPAGPSVIDTLSALRERLWGEQRHRIESYGWIDSAAGIAHIPVAEAAAIIASRGLPHFKAGTVPGPAARPAGVFPSNPAGETPVPRFERRGG